LAKSIKAVTACGLLAGSLQAAFSDFQQKAMQICIFNGFAEGV
jgi:hypothetical protein